MRPYECIDEYLLKLLNAWRMQEEETKSGICMD